MTPQGRKRLRDLQEAFGVEMTKVSKKKSGGISVYCT